MALLFYFGLFWIFARVIIIGIIICSLLRLQIRIFTLAQFFIEAIIQFLRFYCRSIQLRAAKAYASVDSTLFLPVGGQIVGDMLYWRSQI